MKYTYVIVVGSPRWNGKRSVQLLCKGQSPKKVGSLIPKTTYMHGMSENNKLLMITVNHSTYDQSGKNITLSSGLAKIIGANLRVESWA